MAPTDLWDRMTAENLIGYTPVLPDNAHTSTMPGIARSAGPSSHANEPLFSPDNPLFWFGLLLAGTFGLVAISTSVRLGPGRASVSIGKK